MYKLFNDFLEHSVFTVTTNNKDPLNPIKFNNTKNSLMISFRIED